MPVDKVFYINLDQRPDRNQHILKLLAECPWPYERVPAVRLQAPPETLGYKLAERHKKQPHVASIFLSHRRALETATTIDGAGYIIVLEDDVMISQKFYSTKLSELGRLPNNWEMLLISVRYRAKQEMRDQAGNSLWLNKPFGHWFVWADDVSNAFIATGTHFCVFRSRQVAESIVRRMDSTPEIEDVDAWYMKNTNCYFWHSDYVGTLSSLGSNHEDGI